MATESTTQGPPLPSGCACAVHADSVFRVEGLDCREEVELLERRLGGVPGLESLSVDLLGQRLLVSHDAAVLSPRSIIDAVAETGMQARADGEGLASAVEADRTRQRLVIASGLALALGFVAHLAGLTVPARVAFVLTILTGGLYTGRRAWSAARLYSLDINVLMLVAVVGAMIIGQWEEGATVIFLFAVAQLLETRSMARARRAIRTLMDLGPPEAVVRRNSVDVTVPVETVRIGESIIVRPGTRIPLDGVVVSGTSTVNQAPITGESQPADKEPGDDVFAGTVNGSGALEVRVTHGASDTTLARVVRLVESAQATRAPAQLFVDRFARIYTPVVIGLAVAVAVLPPLFGGDAAGWVYRGLVLLVVSCPCALVISTPVSFVSALAAAARTGVLIKGGAHLERTARIRCVAFDKTGTLTVGEPRVVEVRPAPGHDAADVVGVAAALEARSEHPIGRAIVRYADETDVALDPGFEVRAVPGRGVEGVLGGHRVLVGNHRWLEEHGQCPPELHDDVERLSSEGRSAVLVARDGVLMGVIAVGDQVRPEARDAVRALREHGMVDVAMLTGDTASTAAAVADVIGAVTVHAELLPEDKVRVIRDLRERHGPVAMVGDGVNDAPALAAADVGIAMGVAGTDTVLETADVALMADELDKLPFVVRLGRATVRNIRTNVAISLGLKAVFLVLTIAGVATLWLAVLADMGASLFVIGNGLRLLKTT